MTSSKSEVLVTSDAGGQMANLSVWDPDNGSLLTNFKGMYSIGFNTEVLVDLIAITFQPNIRAYHSIRNHVLSPILS